ncbi:MAG: ATP-dependent RNA helicase DbpA [Gammaproteobacteria bacterium]|nr:ATP-dependent RNA helicase DbpA [Gammaproteobacteria bacterium]TVQ46500.1 MAG: ATP-dependent RNA helicase DbpA [Gammaproteobacteria bacterium]
MNLFASLPLLPALREAIDAAGYTEPTAVQAETLPAILAGRDVIAQAPTGSGKTAAFGLGLLQRLDVGGVRTQALVLCPTRELADQVAREVRRLAMAIPNVKLLLLTGGVPLGPQLASLTHAPHIVVGTPGRVADLLRRQALSAADIATLVLDEADRMLDMGFEEILEEIIGQLPRERQTLLFSATWPESVRQIARAALRSPLEVSVEGAVSQPEIAQWFHEVDTRDKPAALAALLQRHQPASTVVFCNTRDDADTLCDALQIKGFATAALHGKLEQRERDEVLIRFANGSLNVLVASDVAARGLDVKALACVVNYELPGDPDVYVHRIGRTARAGNTGLALSLVAAREMPRALRLGEHLGMPLPWAKIPPADGDAAPIPRAEMRTLRIEGGRSDKLRPGDLLGALTGEAGLAAQHIGKIDILATRAFVAVHREQADRALKALQAGKIKGRRFRVRKL